MATTKGNGKSTSSKSSSSSKASSGKANEKTSRCWPGYEPVPGKGEHEQGSCKPKAASKNGGKPVDRETSRKKQISLGGKRAEQAKGKSPSAAERKTVSKAAKAHRGTKSASKTASRSASKTAGARAKAPAKKASTRKASAGRSAAGK